MQKPTKTMRQQGAWLSQRKERFQELRRPAVPGEDFSNVRRAAEDGSFKQRESIVHRS